MTAPYTITTFGGGLPAHESEHDVLLDACGAATVAAYLAAGSGRVVIATGGDLGNDGDGLDDDERARLDDAIAAGEKLARDARELGRGIAISVVQHAKAVG
jgi:hypothetical protein